jgi:hypothetical protein
MENMLGNESLPDAAGLGEKLRSLGFDAWCT